MKTETKETNAFFHTNQVLDYILAHESDDFDECPSSSHVYFHAYASRHGGLAADCMLAQAIAEQEGDNE